MPGCGSELHSASSWALEVKRRWRKRRRERGEEKKEGGGLGLVFGIGDGEELDGFEKLSGYNWLDKEDGKVWAAGWMVLPFAKMMSAGQWSQFLGNTESLSVG